MQSMNIICKVQKLYALSIIWMHFLRNHANIKMKNIMRRQTSWGREKKSCYDDQYDIDGGNLCIVMEIKLILAIGLWV